MLSELQRTADYMPAWQSEHVLVESLGPDWKARLSQFDPVPMAAASIGQVHAGKLVQDDLQVAIKIQFPGVARSIGSDLRNLRMILAASAVLPRGLYLDNTLKVMERELTEECDYAKEARSGQRFAALLEGDNFFKVPRVIDRLSSSQVLTTERMFGTPISRLNALTVSERNSVRGPHMVH